MTICFQHKNSVLVCLNAGYEYRYARILRKDWSAVRLRNTGVFTRRETNASADMVADADRSARSDDMAELKIENVQDYPRPPALEPVPQVLTIRLGEKIAARTHAAYRVLETHHAPTYYLPPEDVQATLRPAQGASFCEWKGAARYYDVICGGVTAPRAAWAYDQPTPGFAAITGFLAFYAQAMEACFVGDMQVTPQPGDFYGGWVTPNLRGTPKGARGTLHW